MFSANGKNPTVTPTTAGLESLTSTLSDGPAYTGEVVSVEEASFGLLELQDELASLESMMSDIMNLDALEAAMESQGLTGALLAYADRDQMLSTAITTMPSLESLGGESLLPGDERNVAACEGIIDAIKNTMSKIAAKASEVAAGVKDRVLKLANAASEKAKQFGAWVKGKTLNAKAKIQAHPKATIFALLAGIGAIVTVITMMWTGIPANPAAIAGWTTKITGAIKGLKIPGFSAMGDSIRGMNIGFKLKTAVNTTVNAIGWTMEEINKFATEVGNLAANSNPVNRLANFVFDKLGGGAKGKFGAWLTKFAAFQTAHDVTKKTIYGAIFGAIIMTYRLVRTVVGGIISVVAGTIGALRRAFGGGSGEEAEAAA